MTDHRFALRIDGVDPDAFGEFRDALYAATDDCAASFRGGVAYACFEREAAGLQEAVASAIALVAPG